MRFAAEDYYARLTPGLKPGAVFLDVPVAFMPPRLPSVALSADGTLQTREFSDAWRTASETQRGEGLPVLMRAKARPVLVLRVGAAVADAVYRRSVWAAPLYGETDPPRQGPNVFPLPSWPAAGLRFSGYADLYQATVLPIQQLSAERYACELSARATSLLLGGLALWAEADPAQRNP